MALITPCIDCNERHPGCHDTCEKYYTYKLQNEEIKERQREYEKPIAFLKREHDSRKIAFMKKGTR